MRMCMQNKARTAGKQTTSGDDLRWGKPKSGKRCKKQKVAINGNITVWWVEVFLGRTRTFPRAYILYSKSCREDDLLVRSVRWYRTYRDEGCVVEGWWLMCQIAGSRNATYLRPYSRFLSNQNLPNLFWMTSGNVRYAFRVENIFGHQRNIFV